jgi:hypothetical protein
VQAGTISGTVALSTLQSNSVCLSGYSGSGPLPNAHVYIFSGANATLTGSQPGAPPSAPSHARSQVKHQIRSKQR